MTSIANATRRQRQAEEILRRVARHAECAERNVAIGGRCVGDFVVQPFVGEIRKERDALLALTYQRIAQRGGERIGAAGGVEILIGAAERVCGAIGADLRAQPVIAEREGLGDAAIGERGAFRDDR
jgi:hypothetical protein